jgi:hypothetical protein
LRFYQFGPYSLKSTNLLHKVSFATISVLKILKVIILVIEDLIYTKLVLQLKFIKKMIFHLSKHYIYFNVES